MSTKEFKLQSDLQKLHCKSNWLIYFSMQRISHWAYKDLNLSNRSYELIIKYIKLQEEIRCSVRLDVERTKRNILSKRAAKKLRG